MTSQAITEVARPEVGIVAARGTVYLDATPYSLNLDIYFDTKAEAAELAAKLPKSYQAKAGDIWGREGIIGGGFHVRATLNGNGANGGTNESGIARIVKSIAKLRALGVPVVYSRRYLNSLSADEVAELLGLEVVGLASTNGQPLD